jgi:hypothetical protein
MNRARIEGDLYQGRGLVTVSLCDVRTKAAFECAFSVN